MNKIVVAAFDFDGTLTYSDSLLPFLATISGKAGLGRSLLATSPALIRYALGFMTNSAAKERLVGHVLKGKNFSALQQQAVGWSHTIRMQPNALKQLEWHKKSGHYCVLVSASLDIYLQSIADSLGFDALACTQLEQLTDGTLTGKFSGPNCWGDEKLRRLCEITGPLENVDLYAYGDSSGDTAMLKAAKFGWFKGRPFANIERKAG